MSLQGHDLLTIGTLAVVIVVVAELIKLGLMTVYRSGVWWVTLVSVLWTGPRGPARTLARGLCQPRVTCYTGCVGQYTGSLALCLQPDTRHQIGGTMPHTTDTVTETDTDTDR